MTIDHEAHRRAFDREQHEILDSCVGCVVGRVMVCEWALYGPEEDPVFEHPDLPFVQAAGVELSFDGGGRLAIGTWQNDDHFALYFSRGAPELPMTVYPHPSNTYERGRRRLTDFPLGRIQSIDRRANEFMAIQEIEIQIGDRTTVFKAAEVDEGRDGRLRVNEWDDSVLIFAGRSDFERTIFNEWAYQAIYLDPAHRSNRDHAAKLPREP